MEQPDEVDGRPIMTPELEWPRPVEGASDRLISGRSLLILYVSNLPVFLGLGLRFSSEEGRQWMLAGVLALGVIGWRLLRAAGESSADLMVGGFVLMLSQLVPVAQVCAGAVGLWVAWALNPGYGIVNDHYPPGIPPLAAFIATLVAGMLLMALAYFLGRIFRPFIPAAWRRPDPGKVKPMTPAELRDF